jgi:NADH-quinone oxidoreductase subunit J
MFWFVFYLVAILLIASSLYVVCSSQPVRAGLSLVLSFFLTAILYILLDQEFIAAIQVLIYAGAILVLFLFIVMLLNLGKQEKVVRWNKVSLLGAFLAIALAVPLFKAALEWDSSNIAKGNYTKEAILEVGSIELFSEALFYQYILAFEFIAVLLLVAAIGAFMLGKDKKVS